MSLQRRVLELEQGERSHVPFVAFPSTAPDLIAAAERAGRPVVRWPINPPRLDGGSSATTGTEQ